MKIFYMVCYVKLFWKYDVIDYKRFLKKWGDNDVILVFNYVFKEVKKFNKIISSDVVCVLIIVEYFKKVFNIFEDDFVVNYNLYDFSGYKVMDIIKNLDNFFDWVMIVGYNYVFILVVNMLGNKYIDNVFICGFVEI